MTYVEGFIVAVPAENREAYRSHAASVWPLFAEFGTARLVEAWEDDVADGKVTDFRRAVQAKEGEKVVFSWFEYESKEARDAAHARMMSDPRMKELGAMPFDAQRMIYGGFAPIVQAGSGAGAYVDGFVAPVREENREAYREMAARSSAIFLEYGALRVVEAMGDDVPVGKVTDYARAVKQEEGETVVYSWIEWPDKATRMEGWNKVMQDPRMKPEEGKPMPFDGKRMFYGGFEVLLDSKAGIGLEAAEREPA
ncbi:MAG: hypothetical protein QOG72_478 [Sphingomonadales bacterium]|jgi:uncharacterized protein YbaA (DUF1428 family)|nr:hypothetical protein [Sphingomonadales bacterium]